MSLYLLQRFFLFEGYAFSHVLRSITFIKLLSLQQTLFPSILGDVHSFGTASMEDEKYDHVDSSH
jgi:hypothetical protein